MFRSFYWDIKMRNKKVISFYTLVWQWAVLNGGSLGSQRYTEYWDDDINIYVRLIIIIFFIEYESKIYIFKGNTYRKVLQFLYIKFEIFI